MTDPILDLVTDDDVLAAYADLPGWAGVEASGAVGPEPMTSRSSPTTSESSSDSTEAGLASLAS